MVHAASLDGEKSQRATLLITVGSTLFPALTDLSVSVTFLDQLLDLSVEKLVVQYGKGDLTLPPVMRPLGRASQAEPEYRYEKDSKVVDVRILRFTDDFEGMVKSAKWVISHAGSGSILSVLRTPRPLLVVPNTSLMDNHQAELADALGEQGYLKVTSVSQLLEALPSFIKSETVNNLKPFPALDPQRFRNIMDETAGYSLVK